jgi:hypothetical protein
MIQLEATATGELLDLYPDTSVELEYINPAFATADESGSFGYPFDLPGTSTNHRISGHAYMLERRDVIGISIEVRLTLFGLPIALGVAKLTYPVSRERIRVFLVVSRFSDLIKNRSIRSVPYPAREEYATDFGPLETRMGEVVAPNSEEFVFYPSMLSSEGGFVQNDYVDGTFRLFAQMDGLTQPGADLSTFYFTAVPHPYLVDVYRRVVEGNGYSFDDGLFSTAADLRQLVLHHHRPCGADEVADLLYIDLKESVPDVAISTFLRSVDSVFCTKPYPDNQRKSFRLVQLQNLLDSPAQEWTDKASPGHEVTPTENNGYLLRYDVANDPLHDTWLVWHFKELLKPTYNSYYNWTNAQTLSRIEELEDVEAPALRDTYYVEASAAFYYFRVPGWARLAYSLKGEMPDPTTLATAAEGDVWYSTNERQYLIYLRKDAGGALSWRHMAYQKIGEQKIGEGETPLVATAQSVNLRMIDLATLPYPMPSDHPVAAPQSIYDLPEDKSLRLLIYRGLDATVYAGYRYPFATPDVYDTRGVKVGTHSLRWEGDHGLYEKFWKRWLDFLGSTRKVTRKLRLTAADIFNLDMTQQVRIENINYLIGKINVAVTMRGISEARAELYSVGSGTEAIMSTTVGTAPLGGIGIMVVGSTNIVN